VRIAPEYTFKTFLVQLTVVYDLIKGFEKLHRYSNEMWKIGRNTFFGRFLLR